MHQRTAVNGHRQWFALAGMRHIDAVLVSNFTVCRIGVSLKGEVANPFAHEARSRSAAASLLLDRRGSRFLGRLARTVAFYGHDHFRLRIDLGIRRRSLRENGEGLFGLRRFVAYFIATDPHITR